MHDFPTPRPRMSEAERERVLRLVQTIYALRAAGDIEGLSQFVAEDIVCFPPTSWGCSRFPTTLRGKTAVKQAFLQRHINYIALPSTIHRLLIDGDSAFVHRSTVIVARGTGEPQHCNAVDFFRFRDGLVVEFSEYPDGAAQERIVAFPH